MLKNTWLSYTITCLSLLALAEEPVSQMKNLKVCASRMPAAPSQSGSSLTVLEAKDLATHGNMSLGKFLQTVPGFHFAQSGPRGSVNSMILRGSTQKYMLVRVDGVNISDPSASQIAPQIEHILVSNIERIEILRGSQSSLYGGQAVAGVIEITTKQAEPGFTPTVQVEGGSYDSYQGILNLKMANEQGFLNFNAELVKSEVFSAADEKNGNTEKDGYENATFDLQARYFVSENLRLKASARYSDHEIEFDSFAFGQGPVDDDGHNLTQGDQTQLSAGMEYTSASGRQDHDLVLSYFSTNRDTQGEYPATFEGDRLEADYVGSQEITPILGLLFGANATEESAKTDAGLDDANQIIGAFIQVDVRPMDDVYFTATGRNDDHSEFGSHATWKSTLAYTPWESTKLRGSLGTGFRAPSLFELFDSQYGNPDLDPESSTSWDIGWDQRFWQEKAGLSVTYFNLEITDQIDFAFPGGYVQIPGESERSGIELGMDAQLNEFIEVKAAYTYMLTAESTSGDPLLRVPEHDLSFTSVYSRKQWTLSGIVTYIAGVEDLNYDLNGPATLELDDFWVLDGRLAYAFKEGKEVFVRFENIFDEYYQLTRGYGTPGRSAYLGLSLTL
jgi:vitamin B12 transporter